MELEGSLPWSQDPANCPHTESIHIQILPSFFHLISLHSSPFIPNLPASMARPLPLLSNGEQWPSDIYIHHTYTKHTALLMRLIFMDCLTWRQRHYNPQKHQKLLAPQHGITTLQTWNFK